jgi:nicotinamidase-related amidase
MSVEALLVIDMQLGSLEAVPDADRLIEAVDVLLGKARAAGALVVHVQNDGAAGLADAPGTPGWELRLPVEPGEVVIRKLQDDAFAGTPLSELLAERDVQSLAICGLMSEMCVSATARTALARDFRVVLPHDAHATTGIPAGVSEAIPASVVSRVAEWALGSDLEVVQHADELQFVRAN